MSFDEGHPAVLLWINFADTTLVFAAPVLITGVANWLGK
jgi:hypothetical protein